MALDVISIVIGWPEFGDIRNRSIGQLVSVIENGSHHRISTKETNSEMALS